MTGVWNDFAARLRSSSPYRVLRERLGDTARLPLPAAAWVCELLAQDLKRPLLVVLPHESDALTWLEAARTMGGQDKCLHFPAPSLTPYQEAEVSLQVRAQESAAIDAILSGAAVTVVCTPRALFRRLPVAAEFQQLAIHLRSGEEHPIEKLSAALVESGYRRVDLVAEVGDFAVRGGVFDLFPPGSELPLRLDYFGDTLESIRTFEVDSQRSLETLPELRVLPLGLFRAGPEQAADLAELLHRHGAGGESLEGAEELEALRRRGGFSSWENLLPLLQRRTVGLAELMRTALRVAVDGQTLDAEAVQHGERLEVDYRAKLDHGKLAAPPDALELPVAAVREFLLRADLRIGDLAGTGRAGAADFEGSFTDIFHGQLPRFPREVETARVRGERLLIVAPADRHPPLRDFLAGRDIDAGPRGAELVEGDLQRGFRLPAAGVVVYGEPQLFAPISAAPRRARTKYGPFLSGMRDLRIGDFVVHADHGIGQFVALRALGSLESAAPGASLPPVVRGVAPVAANESEVMEIAYSGGKRLLLPLARLDQVQKYSGIEGVAPKLDQLGGSSWNKTKARVKKGMRDMADELLKLYAARQMATAPALPADSDLVRQFADAFPFDETPDQLEAIAAIYEDLGRERPMDRLLCGDVGYGKTEVAMRAAFKVIDAGFQVAVLAPTTILADQHWETFKRRFEGFPVEVEMLSRFRTPAEVLAVKKKLSEGRVDILIGTHRLLSKDIELERLALVVIDEEQRFGVAQKERLKKLKNQVHVLAMSATPVPRTLQFSLAGVRDLSVIETPPKDRMAIETAILPHSAAVVREAIEYELERGGQVYYVYNRVESIEAMTSELRELVPNLRITVGHGQLEERELSRRMHAFTAGEYDVLLATTIIENGIDIPNVNTMIVHRADRFGLAQLYQLRGRVGRSNQLAYCYLLVEPDRVLSEDARKRLAALREFSDLGAGFRIAARDLEIRGAGNLLGGEQSGHIMSVGIETYLKLLEETVRELRGEVVDDTPSAAIDLPVAMSIPVEYVSDANLRMELYRRIAAGETPESDLVSELRDRFGPAPMSVLTLIEVAAVKRTAEALRVQSVGLAAGKLTFRLRRDARVSVDRLIAMVSAHPGASFSPAGVLTLPSEGGGPGALELARRTLATLAQAN
ncbi:MAG: transcription-repair coupling factor [Acidobacteriota bacterium]